MKKNIFLVSEQEKNSILNMHINATKNLYLSKYGILKEQVNYYKDKTGKITKLEGPMSAPLDTELATQAEYDAQEGKVAQGTVNNQTPVKQTRYKQGACKKGGNKKECALSIQMRLNDECKSDILNNSLINFPKARTGTEGSFKLKEDGNVGSGTRSAYTSCKLTNVVSTPVVAQQGGGGSNQTQITIPVGGNITANDIQTIIS